MLKPLKYKGENAALFLEADKKMSIEYAIAQFMMNAG